MAVMPVLGMIQINQIVEITMIQISLQIQCAVLAEGDLLPDQEVQLFQKILSSQQKTKTLWMCIL